MFLNGAWGYMQDPLTPNAWKQDQQYDVTGSNLKLNLAGRTSACAFHVLKESPPVS